MPSTVILTVAGYAITTGAIAVAVAATFAVSWVATRIFGLKPPEITDNGVRQQIPPSTVNSLPIVYGDAYLGGTFVDAVLHENQFAMWYVLAVSSISPDGQFTYDKTKMYYGDRLITFDTVEPAKVVSLTDGSGNVDTKVSGYMYIYLYRSDENGNITNLDTNGTSAGSGLPNTIMSTANGVPSGLEWPASGRQMNGTAFAIVKLIYNTDAQTTQLQPVTFRVHHYLNNQGCAKAGDVWLDYMQNVLYGGAVNSDLVDTNSATALNTYGDQLITFTNNSGVTTTQPRYRINGVIDTGKPVLDNVDNILISCDSWMAYNAALGQWSIVINKAESVSMAFTDDNIIGDIRVSTTDINQSINQIEAKFPNALNKDIQDYVFLETPSALLYPNEPVNIFSTTFDLVNDSVQAQYLANRILEQAREDLVVLFKTTYEGIQCNAGDVVSVTNTAYGWNAKQFRIMKVNEVVLEDGSLGASIELNEYNSQVYDDKSITQYTPSSNSNIPSPAYFSGLIPPVVSASYPSATVPTFDITVTMPTTGRVTFVRLFYTTYATPTPTQWKLLDSYTTVNSATIANGSTYVFDALSLPAGSYYFGFVVGNENGQSAVSVPSFLFSWSPTGTAGPTGPRTATGYVYYTLASQTAPSAPTLSGYNFDTGTFSSISANWTTTFNAPNPSSDPATEEGSKFWAVRYYVTEATYEGTQSITTSAPFNWTNLDGLVTFTNLTTDSGTTFIDGGNIIADTITVDKLIAGLLVGYELQTGSGSTPSGAAFEVNDQGVVWADNIFSQQLYAENPSGQNAYAVLGWQFANYEAVRGQIGSTQSGTNAHAVRGVNSNRGTAGLIGPANNYDFYADGSGTNYGPFTGTHDSLVPIGATFTVGDIVVDVEIVETNGISSTISQVAASSQANQPAVLGFVCREPMALTNIQPAVYIQEFDPTTGQPIMKPSYATACQIYNFMPVNSVGEGQINVCGEGGNINAGDLIVTSSMVGKGMKQSDNIVRNITVAKARESVIFNGATDVKTIACIYLSG